MDLKIVSILIGILGALTGVYFREAIRRASNKIRASSNLEANLHLILKNGLNDELTSKLLIVGHGLGQKLKAAYIDGDYQKAKKINEELEHNIEKLKSDEVFSKNNLCEFFETIKNMSSKELDGICDEIDRRIEQIQNGAALSSQEETAHLDWFVTTKIVEIRSLLIELHFTFKLVLLHVCERDEIDYEIINNKLTSCVKDGIHVSMCIIPLIEYCEIVRKNGILINTIK